MKKFLAIALLLVGCNAAPDPSKQASQALIDQYYALDSKTSTGINYIDYSKELGALKASFDKLERDYPKSPALTQLQAAQLRYETTGQVWKACAIDAIICGREDNPKYFLADTPVGQEILKNYSKIKVVNRADSEFGKYSTLRIL